MKPLSRKFTTLLPAMFLASLFMIACSQERTDAQAQTMASNTTATAPADDKKELKEAPNFTLEMMNGEMFTLNEHEGQVIVLNFWATWCPPCRKEIPHFIEIQENMRDEGVLFVGVSLDRQGWEVVEPFVKRYGINYPVMLADRDIYRKYGPFRGIPTTFIINQKGKVAYVALGMIRKNLLKSILTELTSS